MQAGNLRRCAEFLALNETVLARSACRVTRVAVLDLRGRAIPAARLILTGFASRTRCPQGLQHYGPVTHSLWQNNILALTASAVFPERRLWTMRRCMPWVAPSEPTSTNTIRHRTH